MGKQKHNTEPKYDEFKNKRNRSFEESPIPTLSKHKCNICNRPFTVEEVKNQELLLIEEVSSDGIVTIKTQCLNH